MPKGEARCSEVNWLDDPSRIALLGAKVIGLPFPTVPMITSKTPNVRSVIIPPMPFKTGSILLGQDEPFLLKMALAELPYTISLGGVDRHHFLCAYLEPESALRVWVSLAKQHYAKLPLQASNGPLLERFPSKAFLKSLLIIIGAWAKKTKRRQRMSPHWRWDALKGLARSPCLGKTTYAADVLSFAAAMINYIAEKQVGQSAIEEFTINHWAARKAKASTDRSRKRSKDGCGKDEAQPAIFGIMKLVISETKPPLPSSAWKAMEPFIDANLRTPREITRTLDSNRLEIFSRFVTDIYAAILRRDWQAKRLRDALLTTDVKDLHDWLIELGSQQCAALFDRRVRSLWNLDVEINFVVQKRAWARVRKQHQRQKKKQNSTPQDT